METASQRSLRISSVAIPAPDPAAGMSAALNADAGDPAALLQQRDALMAENIELKARLMPHVAEPEPLTEEEVW